jgi:hypothetical protein
MAMILGFLMELPSYLYVDCVACHFAWHIVLLPFCSLSLNRMMRSWAPIKVCLLGKGRRLLTFYLLEEYWVLIFFPSI